LQKSNVKIFSPFWGLWLHFFMNFII
jgi:hypothetical protein